MQTINDVFEDWLTGGGIFTALHTAGAPWAEDVTAINLDIEYHGNIAGMRYISPLIDNIKENDTLTSAEITTLANVLMAVYGDKWEKLYNTINYTFDPTAPYNMTETLTNDIETLAYGKTNTRTDNLSQSHTGSDTRTDDLSQTHTGSDTLTPNITETNTPNLTNGSTNTVNGFNSTVGVQSGAQTVTSTGTNTNTRTGTETTQYNNTVANTGTETTQYNNTISNTGTQADVLSGTDTKTRNYTKTKTGNDGKDIAERIAKQREIYLFNFFRDVVFPDINETLTLAIY